MTFPPLIRLGALPALLGLLSVLPVAAEGVTGVPTALAAGRFLVANASMNDPRFRHSVILLVRYGSGGALGLVVNRRSPTTLAQAFPHVQEMQGVRRHLWLGGPVEAGRPAVLVDALDSPPDALPVVGSIYFSHSEPLMRSLGTNDGARFRIYAGYAGWAAGQLDAEIAQGAWMVAPASVEHIFSDDEESLWKNLHRSASGTWVRRSPRRSVVLSRRMISR